MKLFVEAHTILKNRSGVGWFTHGLVRGLQSHLGPNDQLSLLTHPREPMDIADLLKNPQTLDKPIDWLPGRLYHALKFRNLVPPIDLAYGKGVYIFPNFIRWPLAHSPSVIVVHDLSMFDCPEYSSPQNLAFMTRHLGRSVEKADLIVAVSENSKKTLCDHFAINPRKVIVAHLAAEPTLYYERGAEEVARVKGKYGIFGKYMLFVSTLEPRKNVEGLIRAYRNLPEKLRSEVSLVLVGGRGWRDESIRAAINDARIAGDRVVLPGYVETEDLPALYSGAETFVFPSHYEGFGLPVLEAMSCGTPVISANNSSLPEAGGTAAHYIDADDNDELTAAMKELLTNEPLQAKMRTAGLKQAAKFSWEKSSAAVLKGIEDNGLL
ncbi:MAG TPA: glycosyltransferase family 1 protein [Candidatus Saccharimonadales bacterium]